MKLGVLRQAIRWMGILAVVLLLPPAAHAQAGPEPRLVFSFFGGIANGPKLYNIPSQPLALVFQTDLFDTLALRRTLTTAPTAGINATLYQGSGFGLAAEIVYVGLRMDDTCEMLYEHEDPQRRNDQVCNDISQRVLTVSNVGITLGGAYRLWGRNPVSPYARLQGGIGIRSTSIVETVGRYNAVGIDGVVRPTERIVIRDDSNVAVKPFFVGALGLDFTIGSGYLIRAEIRDQLVLLERPTGPADELARTTVESFWGHAPALLFGFGIVLEQKRGRRY
jgi:hypothetical protein